MQLFKDILIMYAEKRKYSKKRNITNESSLIFQFLLNNKMESNIFAAASVSQILVSSCVSCRGSEISTKSQTVLRFAKISKSAITSSFKN